MRKITIAVLSVAAASLLAVPTLAGAQETTDDTTDDSSVEVAPSHRRGGEKISTVADLLGMEEADLRDALRNGSTVAELADAAGVSVDIIADALVTAAEQHLADHVAEGRLTEEQAAERLADIDERIEGFLNGEHPVRGEGFGRGGFGKFGGLGDLSAVTDLLGLDASEIMEAVRGGSTIAELAEANGSSAEAVVAAMVDLTEERVASLVAEERITQEQADEILGNAEVRITEMVNGEFPAFGEGRGFGRRGGHHGHGGFGQGGANAPADASAVDTSA